jgi:chaperone modulatory protein CbpM
MANTNTDILSGRLIDEESRLSLRELCDACSVHAEFIIELVNEGVIEPAGYEKSHWCFTGFTLRRVRTAKRLKRDLGVNLAGIGLALELLEELEHMRSQLNKLSVYNDD